MFLILLNFVLKCIRLFSSSFFFRKAPPRLPKDGEVNHTRAKLTYQGWLMVMVRYHWLLVALSRAFSSMGHPRLEFISHLLEATSWNHLTQKGGYMVSCRTCTKTAVEYSITLMVILLKEASLRHASNKQFKSTII